MSKIGELEQSIGQLELEEQRKAETEMVRKSLSDLESALKKLEPAKPPP